VRLFGAYQSRLCIFGACKHLYAVALGNSFPHGWLKAICLRELPKASAAGVSKHDVVFEIFWRSSCVKNK
jgi:hypothetical protein